MRAAPPLAHMRAGARRAPAKLPLRPLRAMRRGIVERVHALFILAWALLRSLLAGIFGLRRGLPEFEASYAPDRLAAVTPAERAEMPTFSRCIACGLCDVGEGVRIAGARGAYGGTMDLVLASSRSMPDHDAALLSLAATSDERLAQLEARCPTQVPMRRIAAWVRAKGTVFGAPASPTFVRSRENVTGSPSTAAAAVLEAPSS